MIKLEKFLDIRDNVQISSWIKFVQFREERAKLKNLFRRGESRKSEQLRRIATVSDSIDKDLTLGE